MCRTRRVVLQKFSYALQTDFNTLALWCICKILPRKVEKIQYTLLSEKKKHIDNVLSGPKLQTTNCTDTLSTAVTRHKQQTSRHRRTANNTVKCFFKFMPVVSVSFHQSSVQVLMVCIPSTTQAAKFS